MFQGVGWEGRVRGGGGKNPAAGCSSLERLLTPSSRRAAPGGPNARTPRFGPLRRRRPPLPPTSGLAECMSQVEGTPGSVPPPPAPSTPMVASAGAAATSDCATDTSRCRCWGSNTPRAWGRGGACGARGGPTAAAQRAALIRPRSLARPPRCLSVGEPVSTHLPVIFEQPLPGQGCRDAKGAPVNADRLAASPRHQTRLHCCSRRVRPLREHPISPRRGPKTAAELRNGLLQWFSRRIRAVPPCSLRGARPLPKCDLVCEGRGGPSYPPLSIPVQSESICQSTKLLRTSRLLLGALFWAPGRGPAVHCRESQVPLPH